MPRSVETRPQPSLPCESRLFPPLFTFPVSAYELRTAGSPDWLLPEELASIRAAVPARVAEFAAGRRCAREAMRAYGIEVDAPLLRGTHRQPLWPVGLRGSITHTEGYCAAVVARAGDCAGLGIDVERCGRVEPPLWPALFDASELAALQLLAPAPRETLATLLFAVKEAFFKSQFALSAAVPDFTDVTFRVTGPLAENGTLELVHVSDSRLAGFVKRSTFRYALNGPFALTAAVIQHVSCDDHLRMG